ncbi:MAG: ATP-binding protein [Gemmatimonadales bacterium]
MSAPAKRGRVRGLWALWFVIASLIALVAVPAYLGQRVAEAQTRITDVLGVASSLSSQLEVLKAQLMSRFEAYVLGGDRSNAALYREGKAREDSLFAQLRLVANDLDLDVRQRLVQLTALSASWHVENQLAFASDSVGNALEVSRRGYETLRTATRELDRAIQRQVALGREEVERARTLQARLTLALGILALGATLVVARFGFRLRELSDEAESGWDEAEAARRETAAVLAATDDGVLGVDLEGRCTSLNRAGVELLGFQEHEIRGRNVHDLLFHTAADGSPCPREASPVLGPLATGRAVGSFDGSVLWKRSGESFTARWSMRPQVVGGELRGAVLTFTDMTAIRDKENALRRAIAQREEVVSIVSHDLRNPLGVVLAASDLLIDLPLDDVERKRQTEIIQRSAQRMQSLIEDLLDVARIEAGAFVVRPSLEDLAPIVEEARALFADQAERRGVELCFEREKDVVRARVDRDRLLQALANLLDNALRFTPDGGSVVMGVSQDHEFATVTVSDTGPGIEPSLLEHLFERFSRGKAGSGSGAGLGLAIVKGVAEAHGGHVSVRTERDRGTAFEIRLPVS